MTFHKTIIPNAPHATGLALAAAGLLVLLQLEKKRPLRQRTEPATPHRIRNLLIAAVSGLAVQAFERPLIDRLIDRNRAKRGGLLQQISMPAAVRTVAGAVLMDYMLYLWHVLMHRSPLLWRLHLPHHADLNLDASTGLRFHFAEMIASIPLRVAQVTLLGVTRSAFSVWQTFTIASIVFHHSNIRLPLHVERVLSWYIATPRMHGIHHSSVKDECDSNWSSGLSLWDRLHGTFRLDIPQNSIRTGVPALRDLRQLRTAKVLTMPFRRQKPTWRDEQGRSWRRDPDGTIRKVAK